MTELAALLERGDIVIDGGNSLLPRRHRPRRRRSSASGIHYVDVGTSGGVFGLERGYCLMIGGEERRRRSTSTRSSGRSRRASAMPSARPGRRGDRGTAEHGYLHCGPTRRRPLREDGAQRHRVRPDGGVRRGPQHPQARRRRHERARERDAETTPLRDPEYYQYDFDLADVAEVWRRGSVDRVVAARPDRRGARTRIPTLTSFAGRVSDSGEGRWTVHRRDRRSACPRPC